eukprot:g4035.t1
MLAVDGLRPDMMLYSPDTPAIDALIRDGEWSFHSQVEVPISASSWSNIFTGTSSFSHGVVDNTFDIQEKPFEPQSSTSFKFKNNVPSLFNLVEAEGFSFACRTGGNWDGIEKICATASKNEDTNLHFDASTFEEESTAANDSVNSVIDLLSRKEETPDLVVWYTHIVDYTGHKTGFSLKSDRYMQVIKDTDRRIGALVAAVKRRPDDEDWLIVLTTDHGGTWRKDVSKQVASQFTHYERPQRGKDQSHMNGFHGLNTPSHATNFLVLSEKNSASPVYLRKGGGELFPPPLNVDVTPTILDFLTSGNMQSQMLKRAWKDGFVGTPRGGEKLFSGIRATRATNIRDNETYFHLWSKTPIECFDSTNEDEAFCRGIAKSNKETHYYHIGGIVVGAFVGLGLGLGLSEIVGTIWYCLKKKKKVKENVNIDNYDFETRFL